MAEEKVVLISIVTEENPVKLHVRKDTTAEEIIITVCQKILVGPLARHLFALRYDKNYWCSLNTKLLDFNYTEFDLRIRYRVPNVDRIKKVDMNAFNYFFCQVREDINNNKIPEISYGTHKKEVIGLGVTDMFREILEKNVSEEMVLNDYTKYLPKEVHRKHGFFLKKPMREKLLEIKNKRCDVTSLKTGYLEQAEQMAPNYMTEDYEAVIEEGCDRKSIIIRVNPFNKEMPGMQYQYVGKKEWIYICAIEDLCHISLRSDKTVEISRKTGIPLYIQMKSTNSMVSLLTVLDGYYRLSAKWTFNLCRDLITPSLQKLQSLKCHGPVGEEFAYDKLKKKRDCKPGCYILRESETSYNTYLIDVCIKGRKKPVTYKIEYHGEGLCWFGGDVSECYESIPAFINKYKEGSSANPDLHLLECIPSSEFDESQLLLCLEDNKLSVQTPNGRARFGSESSQDVSQIIPLKQLQIYKGKLLEGRRGLTEVYKCAWQKDEYRKIDVAMKVLQPKYRDSHLKNFLNLLGTWVNLHSSSVVRLMGVTIGNPTGMITEFLNLGPLDLYLQEHKSLEIIDLVEAATYLANAVWHLEEEGIIHGHIRCHKILVAAHLENTFSVRLSDPGLPSPYTEHDLHWIPPEFYNNPEHARGSTLGDIWAFGTTLWQIFSFGKEPSVPDDVDIKGFYLNGKRLNRPRQCPLEVFRLINECWQFDPHQRKRPQAAMRDINQLLYQVFNSRRLHSYAVAKPPVRCNSLDTLGDVSSTVLDGESTLNDQYPDRSPYGLTGFRHFNSETPTALVTGNGSAEMLFYKMVSSTNKNSSDHSSINSEGSLSEFIDRGRIVLQGKIGQGFYGEVFKAIIEGTENCFGQQLVAVKKLKTTASFQVSDFEKEISIMTMLNHPNIVQIKRVIQNPVTLVMEFVQFGDLHCYLKTNKNKLDPRKHFFKYSLDVAEGMKYLGEKQIVHRDLAARNILVADEFHVKISDFGLAQFTDQDNYYTVKSTRELPFKWHAPESLERGKFSSQSDVWSYGVTLYEMFSYGKEPVIDYDGSNQNPRLLLEALNKGIRLPYPDGCPQEVYSLLMIPSWNYEAKDRPSFSKIVQILNDLMK